MRAALLTAGSVALSLLSPAAQAQSGEKSPHAALHQELRQIIRQEVKQAIREALAEHHQRAEEDDDDDEHEGDGHGRFEVRMRRGQMPPRRMELHGSPQHPRAPGISYWLQNGQGKPEWLDRTRNSELFFGAHPRLLQRAGKGGGFFQVFGEDDDDAHGEVKVLRWRQHDADADDADDDDADEEEEHEGQHDVRFFSLPEGRGRVMVRRDGHGDHGNVEVDVRLQRAHEGAEPGKHGVFTWRSDDDTGSSCCEGDEDGDEENHGQLTRILTNKAFHGTEANVDLLLQHLHRGAEPGKHNVFTIHTDGQVKQSSSCCEGEGSESGESCCCCCDDDADDDDADDDDADEGDADEGSKAGVQVITIRKPDAKKVIKIERKDRSRGLWM